MKTVILCGGKGTRIGELTQNLIPKPMVEIGDIPILAHIMKYYSSYGHDEFVLCAGHLSWSIKSYFLNLRERHEDLTIDFANTKTHLHGGVNKESWRVTIAETGTETMTAGRIRRVLNHLPDEGSFLMTYGDGVSDVNLDALIKFHESHGRGLTMTGVIPPGRFGEMSTNGDMITNWAEKPYKSNHYINGGFMVMRRDFAEKYIAPCEDNIMLERQPLERAAADGEMMLYRHSGFWQCMDTLRDWKLLNDLWETGNAPWARNI
jgi:glucose-1-phosphate cytidylyltransferase